MGTQCVANISSNRSPRRPQRRAEPPWAGTGQSAAQPAAPSGRDAHAAGRADAGIIPARLARLASDATDSSPLLATLTPAEMRVLRELATYRTLAEIAKKLSVSRTTIKTQVASLYSKLNVRTRAQAVAALGIR